MKYLFFYIWGPFLRGVSKNHAPPKNYSEAIKIFVNKVSTCTKRAMILYVQEVVTHFIWKVTIKDNIVLYLWLLLLGHTVVPLNTRCLQNQSMTLINIEKMHTKAQ